MCSGVFANNLSDGIIWWHLLVKQYQLFRIALFKGNILYISHRIFVWFFFRSGRFRTMKCSWCMHKWNYVCQQQFYALKWMILLKLSHFQATARERERKKAEFFRLCNRWVQCASFKHHFASKLKYIYGNTGNGKIVMQNHRISYWKKNQFYMSLLSLRSLEYDCMKLILRDWFWLTSKDKSNGLNSNSNDETMIYVYQFAKLSSTWHSFDICVFESSSTHRNQSEILSVKFGIFSLNWKWKCIES